MSLVAVVTGASSGIGKHSAIALSKAGWRVVLTARRSDLLEETARSCPNETLVCAGDITDEAFVRSTFDGAVSRFGRVDLLFNNAGIAVKHGPLETMSLEAFQKSLDVNVTGSFLAAREAVRIFKSQSPQGGRIINNGSLAAHVPRPNSVAYTTSKHAISGLSKCIALDGRGFNITCTQIDIGNASTDMASKVEPQIDVEHVANTVVHIASMPPEVAMLQVNIMAGAMPYIGRG